MKFSRSVYVKVAAAALALAAGGMTSVAQARSNVYFSVGGYVAPGVAIGVSNAPYYPAVYAPPVYVQPAPVYYAPPVYYRPAPVYYAPPVYGVNYYYGAGWRHHQNHKHHKHRH